MYGHDDESVLGEYLAVFSTAGSIPTSQSGYGFHPQVYRRAVGYSSRGLSAIIPQPLNVAGANYVAVKTSDLQRFLQAFGAPQTGQMTLPKSGYVFPSSDGTQKAYVEWQKFSKETAPLRVAVAEDTGSLAEKKADRLSRRTTLVMVHPNVAKKVASAAAAPAPASSTAKPKAPSANISVNVNEMQKIMTTLGVDPKNITDGKYGPTTKAKWSALAKSKNLTGTSSGKSGGRTASVNRKAWNTLKAAAVSAAPVATTDLVVSTAEIQGLLAALGFTAPGNALTDGLYGKTTAGTWAQAATKRKLDPFMAKKTADGRQVVVRKETYLKVKADADAKVSPREPTSLKELGPQVVGQVAQKDLEVLLGRLGWKGDPVVNYQKWATGKKLDARIEPAAPGTFYVIKATFAALDKAAAAAQPPAPPGPQKTQLQLAIEALIKGSTSSISTAVLRQGLNASIQSGRISGTAVSTTTPWEPTLRKLILAALRIPADDAPAWEAALVTGKLVSADGKTVKMPSAAVTFFKDAAAKLKAAKTAEVERLKGFTEVNPAEVIARINNLGVSTKKFDRAGGAKELAQAISVFIAQFGGKNPTGEYVRTDKDKVYVKNDVMLALALAMKAADQREAATRKFRDNMVSTALSASTGVVPVLLLQKAFKDAVLVQKTSAGKLSALALGLYKKVTLSGAFDTPTRDAFTEMARTLTIGPSVQEYQKLLGAQKKFTTEQINAQVTEVRNQVWNSYLDKAVQKKDGKLSVAMLPALAAATLQGAQRYDQNIAKETQQQEQVAAQKKVLDDAVKKSTAILSMVAVQQGLKQMAGPEREKINPTGVKISGIADKATRDGVFQLSAMIFPEGYDLPETMWMAYLKQVGKKVIPGGKVTPTWTGSNYISLPPALANLLAKNAGEWIAKNGPSQVQVVEFKNPSVITVVVPKPKPQEVAFTDKEAAQQVQEKVKEKAKEVVSAKTPAADAEAERLAREKAEAERRAKEEADRLAREAAAAEAARKAELARQQAEAERLAKEREAAAAAAAQQAAREAELRLQAAQEAGRRREAEQAAAVAQQAAAAAEARAQAAQEAAAREQAARQQAAEQQAAAEAGGGGGAQVTGPTISITTPTPQQAGMGAVGAVALGVGALALLLLTKGDKQQQQG